MGQHAPFATCYMVGWEDKRTNNRTMTRTLKNSCRLSGSSENRAFEGCRSTDFHEMKHLYLIKILGGLKVAKTKEATCMKIWKLWLQIGNGSQKFLNVYQTKTVSTRVLF